MSLTSIVFAECDLCRFAWESLPTEARLCRHQCFSVVWQATAKIRPKASPRVYFRMKELDNQELDRTTEAIVPMNSIGGESWIPTCTNNYVPLRASMGQHCSLPAVQRKTAFVEQSWWRELNLFGSMQWCSFPWHKLLLRLAQEELLVQSKFDP